MPVFLLSDRMLEDQGLLSRLLGVGAGQHRGDPLPARGKTGNPNRSRALCAGPQESFWRRRFRWPKGSGTKSAPARCRWKKKPSGSGLNLPIMLKGKSAPAVLWRPCVGIANKLPEHAARLAAVLTLTRDIRAETIGGAEMKAGIVIAQYYAGEALRLFGRASR